MDKYCGIILAGGKGLRAKTNIPKQFVNINDKPVIYYSIKSFLESMVDEIIIVVSKEYEILINQILENNFLNTYDKKKDIKVVIGGKERYDSVFNALLETRCKYVLIHDGARPFIRNSDINQMIECLNECNACIYGIPAKDTIKQIGIADANKIVNNTPDRNKMYCAQTPQGFLKEKLYSGYKKMYDNNEIVTDDSMVIERYTSENVRILEGNDYNFKITSSLDIEIANTIARKNIDKK